MTNIPDDDGRAIAAVTAVRRGDVERLQGLLATDPGLASARIVDGKGVSRTLLHVLADWPGHFPNGARSVAVLATAGADLNAAVILEKPGHVSQETALHWAASSNDVAVLDALLDHGADIEVPGALFTGGTPMSDAVVFAQWDAARRLLERGAQTTLWQAAALGLLERVKGCCEAETPPLTEQITNALWHACRGGQQSVAAYLLDRGANLNWIGHEGRTPLDVAQESGAEDLVRWLVSREAQSRKTLRR